MRLPMNRWYAQVCLFAIFAGLATIAALPYFETRPAGWEVATLHGVDAPLGLENQLRGRMRPIFPNSVVAGGVYSTAELRGAAQAESVVDTHYEGLRLDRFQPVRLASARTAHVSFRVGSQIYWTKKRVTIQPGEVVLTDGTNKIRGRCGNRIADLPQRPVLPEEPTENDMDKPTPDVIVLMPVPANPDDDPQAQPGALPSAVERVTNSMPPVEEDTAWWPVVVIPPVIGGTTFPGGDVPVPLTTTPSTPPTTPAERPLTPPPPETPPTEPPVPITPPLETSPPVTPPPLVTPLPDVPPPVTPPPVPALPPGSPPPAVPPPSPVAPPPVTSPPEVTPPPHVIPPLGTPPDPPASPMAPPPPDVPPLLVFPPPDDPPLNPVPEPQTYVLVGAGLAALAWYRGRARKTRI